jgi:predicted nucleic acid-binding Zn ribbon protein
MTRLGLNLMPADVAYRDAVDRGEVDPDDTKDWQHGYEIGERKMVNLKDLPCVTYDYLCDRCTRIVAGGVTAVMGLTRTGECERCGARNMLTISLASVGVGEFEETDDPRARHEDACQNCNTPLDSFVLTVLKAGVAPQSNCIHCEQPIESHLHPKWAAKV